MNTDSRNLLPAPRFPLTTLGDLEYAVLYWAQERKILQNSTPQVQFLKTVSEMGELADNLAKGKDIRDDIGDVLVTLAIIANMRDTDLTECLAKAYDDIKDRTGTLTPEGVFVKDLSPAGYEPQ